MTVAVAIAIQRSWEYGIKTCLILQKVVISIVSFLLLLLFAKILLRTSDKEDSRYLEVWISWTWRLKFQWIYEGNV